MLGDIAGHSMEALASGPLNLVCQDWFCCLSFTFILLPPLSFLKETPSSAFHSLGIPGLSFPEYELIHLMKSKVSNPKQRKEGLTLKQLKVKVALYLFFLLCINDFNHKLIQIKQSKQKENNHLSGLTSARTELSAISINLLDLHNHFVITVSYLIDKAEARNMQ